MAQDKMSVNMTSGIFQEYADLFHGIGCWDESYHIEIDPSVKPCSNTSSQSTSHSKRSFEKRARPNGCFSKRTYSLDVKYGYTYKTQQTKNLPRSERSQSSN